MTIAAVRPNRLVTVLCWAVILFKAWLRVARSSDSCRYEVGLISWTDTDGSHVKVKVKEVDLYSAFIEVPYTQGAQERITQCYLQTTPYLPLPSKHSPDGASQTEVADI